MLLTKKQTNKENQCKKGLMPFDSTSQTTHLFAPFSCKKFSLTQKSLPWLLSSLLCVSLTLSGCSNGDSGSASTVVIDSTVPSIMQAGETAQGSVALSSTSPSLTSVDATDSRVISISDTSSCSPLLIIDPTSVTVVVDGDAEVFNLTAPAGNCKHVVTFSGSGVSTSTNTSDVNVITDQAVVTVGLYDTNGDETASVSQGGTIKIKFTPPVDWEGVTTDQSYTVSTSTSDISFTNNPCTLTPPTTTACQVTASIGDSVTAANHIFSIALGSSTDVPVDESSLTFTVEAGCAPITVGDYQWAPDANLGLTANEAGVVGVNASCTMNWNTATGVFIDWLNSENYCGHNDWEIPSIAQYGCSAADGTCNQSVPNGLLSSGWNGTDSPDAYLTSLGFTSIKLFYWSGTENAPVTAWTLRMNDGLVNSPPKGGTIYVLPVRSN